MQPRLSVRQWATFLLVNIVVSTLTALLVVRSLTQLFNQPSPGAVLPTEVVASPTAQPPIAATPSTVESSEQVELPMVVQPTSTPAPATPEARPQSTPSTPPAANITISTIVFPGQRNREMVVLVNQGDAVDMTGWTLTNPRGKTYTFGSVVLPRDSYINLHTKRGLDVPTDLFWNSDEPVWRSGDVALLKRGEEVIATYTVP